ncbi:MAG: glycogen synthase [Vampirovibrio sp.]|nr:glycogen synthase [Vampirovibrio sp.]
MNIVFCAAEASPFAKVGGLADVIGSLPKSLAITNLSPAIECTPIVIMPLYGCIDPVEHQLEQINLTVTIPFQGSDCQINIWLGKLPGSDVSVYFLEHQPILSGRTAVYPVGAPELEREQFELYCAAVLPALKALAFQPDILHLHDWHSAALAKILKETRQADPFFQHTRSVLTIHNLAYQGIYGEQNYLRDGLQHADCLTTVSPTYAHEIQTSEYGEGLDSLLTSRKESLTGVLNGLDTTVFDPSADPFIHQPYGPIEPFAGKMACKKDLQLEMGLPVVSDVPVFAMVSRLVDQKGLDILLPVLEDMANNPDNLLNSAQWVIIGSGEPHYEKALKKFAGRSANIKIYIGFHLALAQKTYAGSDYFLMPSRFEPCGLGQLIAMRYGSIPIVRQTGGLEDTVTDVRLHPEAGTGYIFEDYTSQSLQDVLETAIKGHLDNWHQMAQRAMVQDFSWQASAGLYKKLYQQLATTNPIEETASC